jgi:hypothetical protein
MRPCGTNSKIPDSTSSNVRRPSEGDSMRLHRSDRYPLESQTIQSRHRRQVVVYFVA